MKQAINRLIRTRWLKWLDRRIKPSREVKLDQKKIFVFPTRYGFFYLITALLLFIGGINYENSLILNLCFLLVSLFIINILHTFRNLSGLIVKAGHAEDSFAGGQSLFTIILMRSTKTTHEALNIIWHDNESGERDVVEQRENHTRLLLDTPKRGIFKPQRLKIQSTFPLGLIRAWSWIDIDMSSVVYPKPLAGEMYDGHDQSQGDGLKKTVSGQDDFDQLRSYQLGDSLKNVAWKQYARGQGLHVKEFHGYRSESEWLDWDQVHSSHVEDKLSLLCFWVLKFSEESRIYGLRLPGVHIEPGTGKHHEAQCLKALALYGIKVEESA